KAPRASGAAQMIWMLSIQAPARALKPIRYWPFGQVSKKAGGLVPPMAGKTFAGTRAGPISVLPLPVICLRKSLSELAACALTAKAKSQHSAKSPYPAIRARRKTERLDAATPKLVAPRPVSNGENIPHVKTAGQITHREFVGSRARAVNAVAARLEEH